MTIASNNGSRNWRVPGDCKPGDQVGRFTLLECLGAKRSETGRSSHVIWRARCSCGRETKLSTGNFSKAEQGNSGCVGCRSYANNGRKQGPCNEAKVAERVIRGMRYNGISIPEAARRAGMSPSAVYNRINSGWTMDEAMTIPVGEMPQRFYGDPARMRGLAQARAMLAKRGFRSQVKAFVTKNPSVARFAEQQALEIAEQMARPTHSMVDDMLRRFREYGGVIA